MLVKHPQTNDKPLCMYLCYFRGKVGENLMLYYSAF